MTSRTIDIPVDRRTSIADAAIDVLAEVGSRGLTHRAVDSRLDLPDGSTSYYFRTREALLKAASERLVEVDRHDLVVTASASRGRNVGKTILELWISPQRRSRLIARFELYVAASRQQVPTELINTRNGFIDGVASGFASAGIEDPRTAAVAMIAVLEGLMLNELLGTGMNPEQRARAVDALLAGLTGKQRRSPSTGDR